MKQIAFYQHSSASCMSPKPRETLHTGTHTHYLSLPYPSIYTSIRPFIKYIFYLISHFCFQQLQRNFSDSWSYRIAPIKIRISISYITWYTAMHKSFLSFQYYSLQIRSPTPQGYILQTHTKVRIHLN